MYLFTAYTSINNMKIILLFLVLFRSKELRIDKTYLEGAIEDGGKIQKRCLT